MVQLPQQSRERREQCRSQVVRERPHCLSCHRREALTLRAGLRCCQESSPPIPHPNLCRGARYGRNADRATVGVRKACFTQAGSYDSGTVMTVAMLMSAYALEVGRYLTAEGHVSS